MKDKDKVLLLLEQIKDEIKINNRYTQTSTIVQCITLGAVFAITYMIRHP